MLNGILSPDRVTLNWLLIWVREEAARLADAEGRRNNTNLNLNSNPLRAPFPPCRCLAAVNDALHRLPPLCLGRTKNLLRIYLLLD